MVKDDSPSLDDVDVAQPASSTHDESPSKHEDSFVPTTKESSNVLTITEDTSKTPKQKKKKRLICKTYINKTFFEN
jgi:hypothetical protein